MTKGVDVAQFFSAERQGKEQYDVSHRIGKGSYGTVCAGRSRGTGQRVAIKHIDRVFADTADTVRIVRELRFLRLLSHPNIIAVKEVLVPQKVSSFDDIYIVTELMDTDLSHLIKSKTKYDDVHTRWVVFQLLRGLDYIHRAGIVHRDLKPANILLNANCDLRICDFGLARANFKNERDDTPVFWTDYVATRWYRAPELICSYFARYSAAVDIWAVGCIFAELIRRKALFPGHNVYHSIDLITDFTGSPSDLAISKVRNKKAREYLTSLPRKPAGNWEQALPGLDDSGIDLVEKLIAFDPDERLAAADGLLHPYFASFHGMLQGASAYPPPPILLQQEFEWENNKLEERELRQKLYDEILTFHPTLSSPVSSPIGSPQGSPEDRKKVALPLPRSSILAETDVHLQVRAIHRGVTPNSRAVSMPATTNQAIFREAEALAAASSSDSDRDSADGERYWKQAEMEQAKPAVSRTGSDGLGRLIAAIPKKKGAKNSLGLSSTPPRTASPHTPPSEGVPCGAAFSTERRLSQAPAVEDVDGLVDQSESCSIM